MYYLTPKSPSSALFLGDTREEVKAVLLDMDYTLGQALNALDGDEVPSSACMEVEHGGRDRWTVEEVA